MKQSLQTKLNLLKQILRLYQQLKVLLLKKKTMSEGHILYRTSKQCLGKDMAIIHDSLGCAEALNAVVELAIGKSIGGGPSTWLLNEALKKDKRFKQVLTPEKGDIIISATGCGNTAKIKHGHVGIMSDDNKIMSNNSDTGLWTEHWTWSNWIARYKHVGEYSVDYYRLI